MSIRNYDPSAKIPKGDIAFTASPDDITILIAACTLALEGIVTVGTGMTDELGLDHDSPLVRAQRAIERILRSTEGDLASIHPDQYAAFFAVRSLEQAAAQQSKSPGDHL